MNAMIRKAKAGVTLVELLVVILIVTILSVSMLPLLQPFVTESQYAAEAIPVIGNLRTKIGMYQYDKGKLPYCDDLLSVHTWSKGVELTTTTGEGTEATTTTTSDTEKFGPTYYTMNTAENATASTDVSKHLGTLVDVDYQDLKGKRSKPQHYQYYVISPTNNFSYVVACFGDGDGLKAGTGYAVCELNYTKAQKKYIGTWKRYKPVDDDAGAIKFGSNPPSNEGEKLSYCYVPSATDFDPATAANESDLPSEVKLMIKAGWEF